MIRLKDIKAVFFDFDDTLCIHSLHKQYRFEISEDTPASVFDKAGCSDNKHFREFIKILQNIDVDLHLCSFAPKEQRKTKLTWVKEHYGVILKDSCIWKGEIKAEKIKKYCDDCGLRYDQVLFIDDDFRNLETATNLGIQTCCPIEIVNFVCSLEKSAK